MLLGWGPDAFTEAKQNEHQELSTQPAPEVPCSPDDKECTARWIQAVCDCD